MIFPYFNFKSFSFRIYPFTSSYNTSFVNC
uniref:Uncharacterized protein n=1 Tax=Myoviridae sp. ctkfK18 TaxID=2825165 RepID=A0A8S5VHF0_9CAUD|nr:MAG TPA: hypothetical protein [Myoviridae sp. ctkfK18]